MPAERWCLPSWSNLVAVVGMAREARDQAIQAMYHASLSQIPETL
jgi:hypothetical protein